MKEQILIAGYGGQGVVLAGSLIANAALKEGLEVCGMVSYGAEMRGGTAKATTIISDKKIGSPVVVKPDAAIIMNELSLKKYEPSIKEGGLIILNTSECKGKVSRPDLKVVKIQATETAKEIGDKKVANLLMVGAYLQTKGILTVESAINVLKKVLPRAKEEMIELNKKALQKGAELCI